MLGKLWSRLRRYPWLGVRLGFTLGQRRRVPFYRLRNLMLAIDFALSGLRLLAYAGTFVSAFYLLWIVGPLPLALCLLLDLAFFGLDALERRERKAQRLKPFTVNNIDTGSARTLRGEIQVGHLFLGAGDFWTAEERARTLDAVRAAQGWLTSHAERAKVELSFQNRLLGVAAAAASPIPEQRNGYRGIERLEQVITACASGNDFIDDPGQARLVIVHVAEQIRSYAVPARVLVQRLSRSGERIARTPVEYAVVASDEPPTTFAHELLHLFGADDYYHAMSETERIEKDRLLARSIMCRSNGPLYQFTIDGTTAQNIGWE